MNCNMQAAQVVSRGEPLVPKDIDVPIPGPGRSSCARRLVVSATPTLTPPRATGPSSPSCPSRPAANASAAWWRWARA